MTPENEGDFLSDTQRVRKTKMRLTIFILILTLAACSRKTAETPQEPDATTIAAPSETATDMGDDSGHNPHIRYLEGPMPTEETEIGKVGDFRVTLGDFERAVRLGSLFAPDAAKGDYPAVPFENLATPTVQFTTTHAVLSRQVVQSEIARRNIEISDKDVIALYRSEPQYRGFVWLLDHPERFDVILKSLHLTNEDFFGVGRDEIARTKLADLLVQEIDDTELWEAWAFEHNTVSLAVVALDNVPTSQEIDKFVENHPDEIQKFFDENPNRFRQPMRVIMDVLAATDATKDKLEDARKLLVDGKDVLEIALATGLEAQHNVHMIRQESGKAFMGKPGDVGVQFSGPRGAYAWRVIGFEQSSTTELNRGLSREIAAEIMRSTSAIPSVAAKLKKARRLLAKMGKTPDDAKIEKAQKAISKLGLDMKILRDFDYNPNGAIPEYGLAPEVLVEAFKLKPSRPTTKLILSRERVFVAHLVARQEPDRDQFLADKDRWAGQYRDKIHQTVVDRFVQRQIGNPAINLRPLAIKFGILKKE